VAFARTQLQAMVEFVLSFQQTKYDNIKPVPAVIEFLSSPKFIAEFLPFYEQENYKISLLREPKESAGPAPLSATPSSDNIASPVPIGEATSRSIGGSFLRSMYRLDTGPASARGEPGRAASFRRGPSDAPEPSAPVPLPKTAVSLLDDSPLDLFSDVGSNPRSAVASSALSPRSLPTPGLHPGAVGAGPAPHSLTATLLGTSMPGGRQPFSGYSSALGDSGSDLEDGSDRDDDDGDAADSRAGYGAEWHRGNLRRRGCPAAYAVRSDTSPGGRGWRSSVVVQKLTPGLPVQMEGKVNKKDLSLNFRRARVRRWNTYWLVLQHPHVLVFKDRGALGKSTRDIVAKEVHRLTSESFVEVASDYKKRRNVFRFMPVPGTALLLEAPNEEDMDLWLKNLRQSVELVRAAPSFARVPQPKATSSHHNTCVEYGGRRLTQLKHPPSMDMIKMESSQSHVLDL